MITEHESSIFKITPDEKLLHILLCNGSWYQLQVYKSLIQYTAHKNGYLTSFLEYQNGREAFFSKDDWIVDLDIVFIGWEHKGIKGIDIARFFLKDIFKPQIIFFGIQAKNILASYEVNPLYFFSEDKLTFVNFEIIMKKCFQKVCKIKKESLPFIRDGKKQRVLLELVVYIRVDHRLITINCRDNQEILIYGSLKNIEENIHDETFMRVHRGFIVNLKYVDYVDKNELYLTTSESIPIARKYKQELIQRMLEQSNNIMI